MEKLIKYLREVIDENSIIEPFAERELLPFFLRENYHYQSVVISREKCVLLFLDSEIIEISKIQKNFIALQKYTDAHPVLVLPQIRAIKRKRLLENRIAFIVPGTQLYLPFVCMDFREKYPSIVEGKNTFTAITQSVFLYLFYQKRQFCGISDITKKLKVSAISVSRALRYLHALGILEMSGTATRVKFKRINKKDYYYKVQEHLSTPAIKVFYIEKINLPQHVYVAGEDAFAKKTMLSYPSKKIYAVSKNEFNKIPNKYLLKGPIEEDNWVLLESWKYDPGFFTTSNSVDELSLLLSLKDLHDERIDIESEKILGELLCTD